MVHYNSGFVKSDLTGVPVFGTASVRKEKLPKRYSIVDQIDSAYDQGSNGICVSVCMTDMCKYLCRGTGKVWSRALEYFYNSRKNRTIDGMSPREAMEIAQRDKLIRSFATLKNILVIRYSILANGPVMLCLPVYTFDTEFWKNFREEPALGYHAITLVGYDDEKEEFTLRNSWGTSYGNRGYSKFPYKDIGVSLESWTIFS